MVLIPKTRAEIRMASPITSTPATKRNEKRKDRSDTSIEFIPSPRRQKFNDPQQLNESSPLKQVPPMANLDFDISSLEHESMWNSANPPRTPELLTNSKSKPRSPTMPVWIYFTVQIIGMSLQKGSMQNLINRLVEHVGSAFIHIDEVKSKSLNVRIRSDQVTTVQSFNHAAVDLNFKERESYKLKKKGGARGTINVPSNQNFGQFEKNLKTKNAEIDSIKQNFMYKNNEKVPTQTASVFFKGDHAPVKLQGLNGSCQACLPCNHPVPKMPNVRP